MASIWNLLADRANSPLWIWMGDHATLMWWLAAISVSTFVLSLILVPIIIARLPRDYFLKDRPLTEQFRDQHPVIRWLFLIGKNLLGLVLVLGGIAMSLPGVPGQGILTCLIGFMLLNFPGKRQVELWILRRSAVAKVVNWIRRRRGREPLLFPPKRRLLRKVISTSPKQQV
jgi:hypothetical protein